MTHGTAAPNMFCAAQDVGIYVVIRIWCILVCEMYMTCSLRGTCVQVRLDKMKTWDQ